MIRTPHELQSTVLPVADQSHRSEAGFEHTASGSATIA
jgi:hypothetical protein